ncbi:hypothetical protein D3C72_2190720 [compost metagenome]
MGMIARMPGYPALSNTLHRATATRTYQTRAKSPEVEYNADRSAPEVIVFAETMRSA